MWRILSAVVIFLYFCSFLILYSFLFSNSFRSYFGWWWFHQRSMACLCVCMFTKGRESNSIFLNFSRLCPFSTFLILMHCMFYRYTRILTYRHCNRVLTTSLCNLFYCNGRWFSYFFTFVSSFFVWLCVYVCADGSMGWGCCELNFLSQWNGMQFDCTSNHNQVFDCTKCRNRACKREIERERERER